MRKLIFLSIVIGLISGSSLYSAPVDNKLIKLGETRFSVDNASCWAEGVATDAQGNIFVTGNLDDGQLDFLTLKYDTNLVLKSSVTAEGCEAGNNNTAHDIAVNSAGDVYVVGEDYGSKEINSGWSGEKILVAKYGNDLKSGVSVSFSESDGMCEGYGIAVDKTPEENIIITGIANWIGDSESEEECFIQRRRGSDLLDPYTTYYSENNNETSGNDIVVGSDNDVFITGSYRNPVPDSSSFSYLTLKYAGGIEATPVKAVFNADGDYGRGFGIDIGPDGSVFVVGWYSNEYNNGEFYSIKYSNDLIDHTVDRLGYPEYGSIRAYAVAVDGCGNAFVIGAIYVESWQDKMLTVKYDTYMNVAATAVFDTIYSGPGVDHIHIKREGDVAVDKDGNAIVVGRRDKAAGSGASDIVVVKYLGRASKPTITSLSITEFEPGKTYDVVIAGTDLFPDLMIETNSPAADIVINSILPDGSTQVTVNLTVKTGATPGSYYLTVKNVDGESVTLSPAYRVVVPSDDIIPEGAGVDLDAGTGNVRVQGGANGYVNPAKGEQVMLHYRASSAGSMVLRVFTLRGQLVRELTDETIGDEDDITWDCKNADGSTVSSGLYVCYLSGPGINKTKKVAVLK